MSGLSVKFYVTAAFLFGFVGFCAFKATFTIIKYGLGADFIAVAWGACLVFVLLSLICIRQAIRTFRRGGVRNIGGPISVDGFRCPACDSTAILQLPANAVSPFASYECGECGIGLVAASTKLVYLVIVVFAIALIVSLTLFAEERLGTCIRYGWLGFVVLGYCVRQLTRKSIRKIGRRTWD